MRCVAVVGGSGFIGSRLCTDLDRAGVPFRIIDKRVSEVFPDRTVVANVCDLGGVTAALEGCGVIINLAAEHRDDVRPRNLYDEVNVGGARNVCRAAEALGVGKIIFTSSVAVYGFAPPETGEDGEINPFNDYGRTKAEAEMVYREWAGVDSGERSLVIVRPTVVFGERNRGNVYSLLRQIASGFFVMVGDGSNRKSMAYVGNVSAFLQHMLSAGPGIHACNYVDKPDMDMKSLVALARCTLGKSNKLMPRVPYSLGYAGAAMFDLLAWVTRRSFPISRIRVKKFCATTQFASAAARFGFQAPFSLREGLERTLRSEFLGENEGGPIFYSE